MFATHRTGAVSLASLATLCLTIGMIYVIAPNWARANGLDVWNLPALQFEHEKSRQEVVAIELQRESILREIEAAGHIAGSLLDGTLSLHEAMDHLAPMLEHRPGFDIVWSLQLREPTFRHGVARYAINRALLKIDREGYRTDRASFIALMEAQYAEIK